MELGRRARVLVAVPLAAVIAVLAAAYGASIPASQTHHVVVAAARGLDPPIVDD